MNPTSVDIKDIILAESSIGLTFATDLFVGREPNKPDFCVTIFDTAGGPPTSTLVRGEVLYFPSVQIRVRGNDYREVFDTINDIKVALHDRGPETWNGTLYRSIRCSIEPALLDWDENDRVRLVTTFDIVRR